MFRTARAVALVVSCGGMLLAGCSAPSSVHNGMIDKPDLEKDIVAYFHQHLGDDQILVDCPAPLKAEVGQTETCSSINYSLPTHVVATIASVRNGNPQYNIELTQ